MEHITKFFTDRKYKVINVTASIKHVNDITNYMEQRRSNVVLYIEPNDTTRDILVNYCNGLFRDCLLIINEHSISVKTSEPQQSIERQLELLIGDTHECDICSENEHCVACIDCSYILCTNCICKLCDADKKAMCPKCKQTKLCHPKIFCNKCNRNWIANTFICKKCNRLLCEKCIVKDATFASFSIKKDIDILFYVCGSCVTPNVLMTGSDEEIKRTFNKLLTL
jgi:hypothetical protein